MQIYYDQYVTTQNWTTRNWRGCEAIADDGYWITDKRVSNYSTFSQQIMIMSEERLNQFYGTVTDAEKQEIEVLINEYWQNQGGN